MPNRPDMCTWNTLPCRCTTAVTPQARGAAGRSAARAGNDVAVVIMTASPAAPATAAQARHHDFSGDRITGNSFQSSRARVPCAAR
jgi:hypothetical protein